MSEVDQLSLDHFLNTKFGGNIPWMAAAPENKEIAFAIKLETIEVVENEVPWRDAKQGDLQKEGEAMMQDIEMEAVDDGTHLVPFWAADALVAIITQQAQRKGWLNLAFKRTTYRDVSKWDGKDKEYNEAHFAEV